MKPTTYLDNTTIPTLPVFRHRLRSDCSLCGSSDGLYWRDGRQIRLECARCGKWLKWRAKKGIPQKFLREMFPEDFEEFPQGTSGVHHGN